MIRYLWSYGATALAFVILDGGWLTLVGPRLYKPAIGEIMTGQVRIAPAIAFYAIYIAGVVILAERTAASWREAALLGGVLGLVAYGTYGLTDQAILKVWATRLTVLDMSWGMVATAAAATVGWLAMRRFG
jgi:uncharacterized membrane protein